ncbi:YoaK family protein [Sorangium sp. So ce1000]|uniref:YoaK family protein n=1 Tax=Sorangium sp. So ce1000 TaxID=3133325 RepID=UPI003F608973
MQIARKAWPALVLNGVAGFVDIVGYVALSQVFTANMTGNTLAAARGIAGGDLSQASRRGFAIPMFVAGMIASRVVVHRAERRGRRAPAWLLYGIEAALLAAMVLVGERASQGDRITSAPPGLYSPLYSPLDYLLVALPSAAMGLQNATLTRFGPLNVRTTHVTGTLAEFSESAVAYLVWLRDEIRSHLRKPVREALAASRRQRSLQKAVLLGGAWLAYVAGGIGGALLLEAFALWSLGLPIAALLLIAAVDRRGTAGPAHARRGAREAEGEGARAQRRAGSAPRHRHLGRRSKAAHLVER